MAGEVLVARDGDIATVTLSNPERTNALDLAMWERLGSVSRELDCIRERARELKAGEGVRRAHRHRYAVAANR